MGRILKIHKRVLEHYNYLMSKGYEVVCTMLQGSQNYNLDEYTEEYMSDVDTKSIVLPSLDDFINAETPISKTEVLDNDEHAEVKDIRIMFDMFLKMNISYIELLYSQYIIINPKYAPYIYELFKNRDLIAYSNPAQFIKCIAGMAHEKYKALCHPYPSIKEKIDLYGFDGKQLSHAVRLYEFLIKYRAGKRLEECYISTQKEILINYKKQRDSDGKLLSANLADKICKTYIDAIDSIKEKMLEEIGDKNSCDAASAYLKKLKYQIMKDRIIEQCNPDLKG